MAALIQSELSASLPEPVGDYELFDGSVRVLAYGKPHNWSLSEYNGKTPEAELNKLPLSLYLPGIVAEYKLPKILQAPSPALANAEICAESDVMKKRVSVFSTLFHNSSILNRGTFADGMLIRKGDAYLNSPAGCPNLIVWHKPMGLVGVAHMGLRSLVDEGRLKGKPRRRYESAVMSLVEAVKAAGVRSVANLQATIVYPIDPQVFTYLWDDERTFPDSNLTYGPFNQTRTEELVRLWGEEAIFNYRNPKERRLGRPDLMAILSAQLQAEGVPRESISIIGAPSNSEWPNSRQDGKMRGLMIVQHL